jgi:hypothetical protein
VIYGDRREECVKIAENMSRITGIKEYRLLFSEEEFKRLVLTIFNVNFDKFY